MSNPAFADGWKRLQAWATANGDSLNGSNQLAAASFVTFGVDSDFGGTVTIISIVSLISVTAIGGYFFLRKRKEQ